jgi:glutaredoxin-like protein NrdH
MDKVLLLTKNDCPNCKNLKLFLKMALGDKYAPDILEVHQLDQASQFKELISKYQITSTPALIYNNDVVRYFQPQDVVSFFHKHLGKR